VVLVLSWLDKSSGETQIARFDIVSQETIEHIMQITTPPVEDGSKVVDHAVPENARITIEGYVSNKPLYSNPGVEKLIDINQTVTIDVVRKVRGTRPARVSLNVAKPPIAPNAAGLITAGLGALVSAITGGPVAELAAEDPDKYYEHVRSAAVQKSSLLFGDFPDRAKLLYEKLFAAQQARTLIKVAVRVAELDNMLISRLAVPRTPEDGSGATYIDLVPRGDGVQSKTVAAPIPAELRGAKLNSAGSKAAQESKNDAKKQNTLQSALFAAGNGLAGAFGGSLSGGTGQGIIGQ